jgi:PAS domain S-box-containing protein
VLDADPRFLGWLVDSMRSGLVAIDREGRLATLNPGAQQLLGLSEACVGAPARDALRERPELLRLLESALDGRERPSRSELVLEAVGARPALTIGFTLDAIRDAAGEIRGVVFVFRDLSPIERRDEQERLRDRLAALGQMAAGLAHELRNPLAGMEVLAGLLKRRLASQPEELVLVGELVRELRTLARTVTESLEFVRPVPLERKPVDPVELLEESLALARSRVPFSGEIEREYDEELPQLEADAEQLRTVYTNLIVNALEAMVGVSRPEGHRLVLGLRVRRAPRRFDASLLAELETTVADSGGGVSPELRERIFHPFFTTKERGSGVGLAHAQKVVAGHGGGIEIDGEPGRGAVFRVRLPIEAVP